MLVCCSTRRRCEGDKLPDLSGCFGAVQRERRLCHLVWIAQPLGILSDKIKFMPAPVTGKKMAVCVTVVKMSFVERSLQAGLDVRVTSASVGAVSRGSRLSAVV